MAVAAARWGAHRNKHRVGLRHSLCRVAGESEPPFPGVAGDQVI